jgi:hypothetical protein
MHYDCAQPSNDTVCRSKDRCSRARSIEDQKLMFYQQRFCYHGTGTAGARQFRDAGQ